MAANKPTLAAALHKAASRAAAEPATRTIGNGDVLIAAITSCTNTSNPSVHDRRRAAREEGGRGRPEGAAAHQDLARAGLAHRHRVPDASAGLLPYLDKLGFSVAAYGCTTCIGNAGDLTPEINDGDHARTTWSAPRCCRATATSRRASIPNLKANFLASPPLVVAYAIAGTVLQAT